MVLVFVVYLAIIFRIDEWLYEQGVRWHSDHGMDYANVFDPNPQKLVADHEDKVKKKEGENL